METKKLCASPLTIREKVKLLTALEPAINYLGSPGDWGYDTKLGDLTIYLKQLRAEIEEAEAEE